MSYLFQAVFLKAGTYDGASHKTATLLYCREAMFGARPIRQTTPFLPVSDRQKDPIGFADGEPHFEVARGDRERKGNNKWTFRLMSLFCCAF